MLAVILNSGMGSRMGDMTEDAPKCFVRLPDGRGILERQLSQLQAAGVRDVLITTGPFPGMIEAFVGERFPGLRAVYVRNERFAETNYIYSLYLALEQMQDQDILLMHGDLVFEDDVLRQVLEAEGSCMVCDPALPLPEKDFKAVLDGDRIRKVGIEFFECAAAVQPLYKLLRQDWQVWAAEIAAFCESGNVRVYAENAFNGVSDRCRIHALDIGGRLCCEVDNQQDLELVSQRLKALKV